MRILKFEGSTMREALANVKAELGDTAVVVSTRQIRRGLLGTAYEIAAAIDTDDDDAPAPQLMRPALPLPAPAADPGPDMKTAMAPMRAELRSLRAMVRASSDGRATTELKTEVASLRRMLEEMRSLGVATPVAPTASAHVSAHANERPPTERPPTEIANRSGSDRSSAPTFTPTAPSTARVIALVGPTGVGKTTTIAKLAARAALADGRRVAVITVDSYRVGGVDQIRTFTDLIGVPLMVARPDELGEVVDSLAEYDLILVDTTGRSPRDASAIVELAAALHQVPDIEVHLTVPAVASSAIIDDLHRRYRPVAPKRLLFTKLDEVDEAPELAHAPGRLGLPLTWITTGQQVPEDLEEPTTARITELAGTAPTDAHAPRASRTARTPNRSVAA